MGQQSAQQQNVSTAGTAGVTASQGVFNQAFGTYTQLQNATSNVSDLGNLLVNTMAQGGINPSDSKWANQGLSAIRNQLSSTAQAQFDSTLASLQSRASGLLSAGGNEIPTAITANINKILDGSLPVGALSGVLAQINSEGQILLNNQYKIMQQAYQGITNPNNPTQTNGTQSTNTNTGGSNAPTPPGLF